MVCSKEERTHDDACYSDPKADTDAAPWVNKLPKLTGNWAQDVKNVAKSQIGYAESEHN